MRARERSSISWPRTRTWSSASPAAITPATPSSTTRASSACTWCPRASSPSTPAASSATAWPSTPPPSSPRSKASATRASTSAACGSATRPTWSCRTTPASTASKSGCEATGPSAPRSAASAPLYADKAARIGLRAGDLLHRDELEARLGDIVETKNVLLNAYGAEPIDFHEALRECLCYAEALGETIQPIEGLVNEAVDAGRTVLFEGAQGTLLDVDFGTYPFVTASTTTARRRLHRLRAAPAVPRPHSRRLQGLHHPRRRRPHADRADRRRRRGHPPKGQRVRRDDGPGPAAWAGSTPSRDVTAHVSTV